MSEPRTVILADGSRLLREMVRRVLEKTEGLQVVAEVERLDRLVEEIKVHHPDWVILFQPSFGKAPDHLEHLFRDNHDLRIAILSSDENLIRLKWMEFHDESLRDLTLDALTCSLREKRGGN